MKFFSFDVPHLDHLIVAAAKEGELSVMLEISDEGVMGFDGVQLHRIMVEDPAVVGPMIEDSPDADG